MPVPEAPAAQPIGYQAEIHFADGRRELTKRHLARFTLAAEVRAAKSKPGYLSHEILPVYAA